MKVAIRRRPKWPYYTTPPNDATNLLSAEKFPWVVIWYPGPNSFEFTWRKFKTWDDAFRFARLLTTINYKE